MRTDDIREKFKHLDLSEKLLLAEELWDDIAASNDSIPLQEWQQQELDKRLQAYRNGETKQFDTNMIHENLKNKYK